ncbi:MAG TPA: hypothetical protein VMQ59_05455, partial [Acidimicrobiales bacterium]|nr:hypothetical protein [Acidimicrobiales bacterium]
MADGPDPLGKRALFWMPVDPQAVTDTRPSGAVRANGANPAPRSSPRRHARPAGKHALYSDATPAGEPVAATATATAAEPVPPRGVLSVCCSSCGSVSQVGLVEFVRLQFPFGVWLPRRRFDRRTP